MNKKVYVFDRYNIEVEGWKVHSFALQKRDRCVCEDWATGSEVVNRLGAWAG